MRKPFRSAVLVLLICAVTAPLSAADHVATLRFSSLDAVMADVERIYAMAGEPKTREQIIREVLGQFGFSDDAWIDGAQPIVVRLPAKGMMNMGWVGALPVKDAAETLSGLERRLGAPEVDGELHAFVSGTGATIQVRPAGDYLLFGQLPTAVRDADLNELLDFGSLPPGNVVLDLDLVPLTAMAQFGMAAARQGVEDGLELDESDAAGREAAMSIYDLYVGMANDVLLNASRLQVSFEVGTSRLILHKWLLPRAGSTLAGLLKAQKSGFPDIAKRLNVEAAVAVMAMSVDFTDEFRVALKEFSQDYIKSMNQMGQSMGDDDRDWYLALMGPWTKMADQWVDCTRGDGAASYDFGADMGFRVTQLAGLTDGEGCSEIMSNLVKVFAEMPAQPDGRALVQAQENAFVHSGVQVTRVDLGMLGEMADADEESAEFMEKMFGGETYVSYMGMKGDVLISSAGAGSEQAFKETVDNLSARKKRGGISPKQFDPLKADAGIFMALDASRLMQGLATLDTEDEDLQRLNDLADKAGRWVFGTHLHPDALRIELNMPISVLEILAALDEDDDDGQEHEEDGDPHDHHDEESGKEAGHSISSDHS